MIHWFLENRLIHVASADPYLRWGDPYPRRSIAYCCPACGEVWAKIMIEGATWEFVTRKCKRHGPPYLLSYKDDALNDSASLQIWAREFLIAFEHFSKTGSRYDTTLICRGL